jgi:uncharacterized membrane protein
MKSENSTAFISYLYLLGLLIAYLKNKANKSVLVSFHIRQSLGLWLGFFMIGYPIGSFDSWTVTISFWAGFTVLIVYGIFLAMSGFTTPIPLVGKFFQKIFKNIY